MLPGGDPEQGKYVEVKNSYDRKDFANVKRWVSPNSLIAVLPFADRTVLQIISDSDLREAGKLPAGSHPRTGRARRRVSL